MLPLTVNAVLVNTVSIADKTPTGKKAQRPLEHAGGAGRQQEREGDVTMSTPGISD